MSCDEIEELLGAHALDALPEGSAARVDMHLSGCPEQGDTLAGLKKTASLLALTAEERRPPAELRQRIVEAIRSGAAPARAAGASGGPAAGQRRPAAVDPAAGSRCDRGGAGCCGCSRRSRV